MALSGVFIWKTVKASPPVGQKREPPPSLGTKGYWAKACRRTTWHSHCKNDSYNAATCRRKQNQMEQGKSQLRGAMALEQQITPSGSETQTSGFNRSQRTTSSKKVFEGWHWWYFLQRYFQILLRGNGVKHETSVPYSPHQNGTDERGWCTVDMSRCPLPKCPSNYAVQTAVIVWNRGLNKRTGKTPYQILTGKIHNLS